MSKTPSEHGTLFCEYECNQWVSKALELGSKWSILEMR